MASILAHTLWQAVVARRYCPALPPANLGAATSSYAIKVVARNRCPCYFPRPRLRRMVGCLVTPSEMVRRRSPHPRLGCSVNQFLAFKCDLSEQCKERIRCLAEKIWNTSKGNLREAKRNTMYELAEAEGTGFFRLYRLRELRTRMARDEFSVNHFDGL
jgi:hypothetical protein